MFNNFYQGKRVLVTGHTGFKGAWLSLWLKELGARVHGLSLAPPTQPNAYEVFRNGLFDGETECDVRHLEKVASAIREVKPDVVFHLAAQSLVRRSYADPIATLSTNATGTAHVLEAVRSARLPAVVLVVTSDKCYENREWPFAYRENDPLGGHDVYSMSKAAAELVAQSWNKSFFVPDPNLGPVATARAGNVIGGGDYAENRLVPDCVRALLEGKPILVRNPRAVRPWQHVLESLSGYLDLAARLGVEGKTSPLAGAFNFGPDAGSRQPAQRVVEEVLRHWPGEWVDGSDPRAVHEATLLTLAIDKASALLGWRPVWEFEDAIRRTVEWYRKRHVEKSTDLVSFSKGQIRAYAEAAKSKGVGWANG